MGLGKLFDYGTPAGWVGLAGNKFLGTPKLSEGVDSVVDEVSGKKGLETAAAGAKEAQAQAQALAQLQWDRQMQGLQEARGQTQPYLSLYDKIYGTNMAGAGAQAVAGAGGAPRAVPNPTPYNQSMAPRQVGPGRFLPAGRVAGDAIIQEHLGGNPLPGGPAYAGLPNGNAANPFVPPQQDQGMDLQSMLRDYLNRRGMG